MRIIIAVHFIGVLLMPRALLLAQAPNGLTNNRGEKGRIVHHVTPELTLIEHGDTIVWLQKRTGSASIPAAARAEPTPYRATLLLDGDSTYILTSKGRSPMDPFYAKHVRFLLQVVRDEEAGLMPKPRVKLTNPWALEQP